MSKKEADKRYKDLRSNDFKPMLRKNNFDEPLREELLKIHERTLEEKNLNEDNISYTYDYTFALKMYKLFQNGHFALPLHLAASTGLWRFISLNIIPDVVNKRWGDAPDHFYIKPNRIWLKTLWWYIFLSWQGSVASTEDILKDNTTDTILNLVERVGSNGYRVEMSRELMKQYGLLPKEDGLKNPDTFRKVMKLNTARTKSVEPSLIEGGTEIYVRDLFEHIKKQ